MPDHPKIEAVGGDAAWLWVCALAHSHRYQLDGVISAAKALKVSDRKHPERLIRNLVRERMLHEPGHNCDACPQPMPGCYVIHDYLDWQHSFTAERRMRDAKGAGGSYGNHQRWHAGRGITDPSCQFCIASPSDNRSDEGSHMRSVSDRSSDRICESDADRITDRMSESHLNGDSGDHDLSPVDITPPIVPPSMAQDRSTDRSSDHGKPKARTRRQAYDYEGDLDFQRFWAAYPVKSGKPAAFKAWLAAMQRGADPELVITAAKRYADDPKRDAKHTKYPQGWLNDERYNDYENGGGNDDDDDFWGR